MQIIGSFTTDIKLGLTIRGKLPVGLALGIKVCFQAIFYTHKNLCFCNSRSELTTTRFDSLVCAANNTHSPDGTVSPKGKCCFVWGMLLDVT